MYQEKVLHLQKMQVYERKRRNIHDPETERTAACGGYYRQKYFVYIFQNGDEFIAAI